MLSPRDPDRQARRLLGAIGAALLLAGCGSTGADKAPPSPVGAWTAHGRVLASYLPRQQPVGTVVDRSWLFERRCVNPGRCDLALVRQAQYGTEVAGVLRDRGALVATFTNNDDDSCIRGVHGTVVRHFRIWLDHSAKRLRADERVEAAYPGCGPAGSTSHFTGHLAWTATRAAAPAEESPSPASGSTA